MVLKSQLQCQPPAATNPSSVYVSPANTENNSSFLKGQSMIEMSVEAVAEVQCQGWTRRTQTYCMRLSCDADL